MIYVVKERRFFFLDSDSIATRLNVLFKTILNFYKWIYAIYHTIYGNFILIKVW